MTLPSEIAVDGNPQITNLASRVGVTCTGRTESLSSSQSAQVQYAVLLKSGTEKDKVIAGLRARISTLEGELYLVQLAHSGDTSDSLGRSLNQFDIASARTCGLQDH
ncbi:hypothetical protein N7527_006214 [Penicillium freii]|nr:hypothetical protein N7527_006214 [Penicillium freii]